MNIRSYTATHSLDAPRPCETFSKCFRCGRTTKDADLTLMNTDYSAMEWGCPECVEEENENDN